jgi:hypothetical protein
MQLLRGDVPPATPSKPYGLTAGKAVADDVCEGCQEGLCGLGVDVHLFRYGVGEVSFNHLYFLLLFGCFWV